MTQGIPQAARDELIHDGKLRAGINFQNPLLTTRGPNGEPGGVAIEFSRELAKRLGVELEIVSYQSAGALAESVNAGAWEVAVLAEDAERAKVIEFATPLTEIEATYLVPAGSSLRSVEEVDRPGVRIASPAKSAFDLYLIRTIKQAQLVSIAGTKEAEQHFLKEKLDAMAGLKPPLLEAAERIPGSRILDGRFMVVRHTVAMPKGRAASAAYIRELVEDVKASGLVTKWIEKSGVRGLSAAPAANK